MIKINNTNVLKDEMCSSFISISKMKEQNGVAEALAS